MIRDAIREAAGSALAGLYLFGSLVVGDFDVDVSDIDLIAMLTSDPSDDLVARLGRMHDALASENPVWAGRIEVIYVGPRRSERTAAPEKDGPGRFARAHKFEPAFGDDAT